MLVVENLSKTFTNGPSSVEAVKAVSMNVEAGEFVSVVGKSGSGKSTLLSLLGALDVPTSGSIQIDGAEVPRAAHGAATKFRRERVGFVFQNYHLIANLTAVENVMLPMEMAGVKSAQRRERAIALLDKVGISGDKLSRKPGRLSGGEQQRVAIARALANSPTLILADEPTGSLDSATGEMVFELLRDLAASENTTIVVVTHDKELAAKTDRTFVLKDGELSESA